MSAAELTLWRIAIDSPEREAHDLGGKVGEILEGRWNMAGTPVVYASTSRALALLETLAHVKQFNRLPQNRFLVCITVPASAWKSAAEVDASELVGWDAEPPGKASLDWGDSWLKSGRSLLARVPSVLVPEEFNVLLNPAHPGMEDVKADKVRKWLYDERFRTTAP